MTTDNSHHQETTCGPKLTMPWRHVSDPKFKYRDSAATDVRRTWRKARLLMRLQGVRA